MEGEFLINYVYWGTQPNDCYHYGTEMIIRRDQSVHFLNQMMAPGKILIKWQAAGNYQAQRIVPQLPMLLGGRHYRITALMDVKPTAGVMLRVNFYDVQGVKIATYFEHGQQVTFKCPIEFTNYEVELVNLGCWELDFQRLEITDEFATENENSELTGSRSDRRLDKNDEGQSDIGATDHRIDENDDLAALAIDEPAAMSADDEPNQPVLLNPQPDQPINVVLQRELRTSSLSISQRMQHQQIVGNLLLLSIPWQANGEIFERIEWQLGGFASQSVNLISTSVAANELVHRVLEHHPNWCGFTVASDNLVINAQIERYHLPKQDEFWQPLTKPALLPILQELRFRLTR